MSTDALAESFPDEVVTRALVRYADVGGLPGPVAMITLDNGLDHTRPSTFGPAGLVCLDRAIDDVEAHSPAVSAIAVTGKPYVFAVGADLSGVPKVRSRDDAVAIGRLGHRVFGRLRASSVPTFALINGAALGGGLELALSCHYRTLSTGAGALAFPECYLGLVPGWGGSFLLPHLIGAESAIAVIVDNALSQNRMLRPAQAHQLGIADAMFEPADFIECSIAWAAGVVNGDVVVRRRDVDRGSGWDDAVTRGRAAVETRLHGAAPAPYRALDLIAAARDADIDTAFAAEDEALGDLLMSEELRSGLYAFDLVHKRARRAVGAPDPSLARQATKVGVVGAGLMARQLALLFAHRLQVPVVLTDVDAGRLEAGVTAVHRQIEALAAKGRITPDTALRLVAAVTGSPTVEGLAGADVVIEAVFEDIDVKRRVFAGVERVVARSCLLATNTSSLSVSAMAERLRHPERVVGLHFFNPVAVLPLVEVVRARATDEESLATAVALANAAKKSAVLVRDAPGFVVNRLLTRMLGEVIAAIDEGTPIEDADRALDPLGLPMAPMVLLALVGPPVALHVAETLHDAFPDRFAVSDNLRRLVDAGKPGIYLWDGGEPRIDPDVSALFTRGSSPSTVDDVRARALAAVADEARRMLDEKVVAGARDIDECMILGAGWPLHLGGITPYLDRTGISERVTGQRFLSRGVASPLP
ncbi:MAG: 3-hydroxyacyl-CoA dehydrogenase NAD-binding domain-containing protein [Mycobacteriales bacterium]|nr:MAG: 3-hydroxyacyl-CoA dehydrogenase [Pseudonocardiales bacterium]